MPVACRMTESVVCASETIGLKSKPSHIRHHLYRALRTGGEDGWERIC